MNNIEYYCSLEHFLRGYILNLRNFQHCFSQQKIDMPVTCLYYYVTYCIMPAYQPVWHPFWRTVIEWIFTHSHIYTTFVMWHLQYIIIIHLFIMKNPYAWLSSGVLLQKQKEKHDLKRPCRKRTHERLQCNIAKSIHSPNQHQFKPYGLRMGYVLNSYACQGRWCLNWWWDKTSNWKMLPCALRNFIMLFVLYYIVMCLFCHL